MDIFKLKNKILQLAMQGKLVKQNTGDEPINYFLEKVAEKRAELLNEKKIKKTKAPSEIKEEEKYFELPKGWQWVRLGDLFHIVRGSSPRPKGHPKFFTDKKTEYNWVTIKDITQFTKKNILSQTIEYLTYEGSLKSRFMEKGEIIIAVSGSIGKTAIMGIDGYIYDGLAGLKPIIKENILRDYIFLFLSSWKENLNQISEGTSIKNINTDKLNTLVIALPPIEEQKRIVDKVNELFVKVNELEDNQSDLLQTITDTKNKVLQLAIQGKIVEQNEEDEPASILLENIKNVKNRLIAEKKIKKEKPLDEISEKEKPFDLPNSWEWVRLNDICSLVTDGTHHTPTYTEEGIPFISVKDITKGIIDFSDTKFVSEEEHEQLIKRCHPEYEDVLLTKIGTTGIAKVVDTEREFSLFVSVALLKIFKEYIDPYYLEYLINSPFVRKQSKENTQGIGNKNLVIRCIKNFVLPIPPLEEQKRIVQKLDMLMSYFNELENVAE